ncbi:hypothetical protein JSY14_06025 [Brachybacterium sp. EF45031]|uniref:hypothetical protein n=1 Tax=Brachybacterium sillae TaxID=2810536 RepID=UPI00217E5EE1|nr:hypothetical protein [Brachybacterium sillae]MCS6711604.1 hypothetical protein [Brachybacterium sillae]
MDEIEVVDVSPWSIAAEEPAGDHPKLWLRDPGAPEVLWLFKQARRGKQTFREGRVDDFHWADAESEVIASRLSRLIDLPTATVELAVRDGIPGCISRDVRPPGSQLFSGDVLLTEVSTDYVPNSVDPRDRTGHTLENIEQVLRRRRPTEGSPGRPDTEVFAGYLVFDAWIANGDRHSGNWAMIEGADGARRLAPSFDHGSALGAGVAEDSLVQRDPQDHSRRGKATRFGDGRDVTLVDYALRAVDRWGGPWIVHLVGVDREVIEEIVRATPRLSDHRRIFITQLLAENRRRLIER